MWERRRRALLSVDNLAGQDRNVGSSLANLLLGEGMWYPWIVTDESMPNSGDSKECSLTSELY